MLSLRGRKEMLRRKQVACGGGAAGKPQKSPARGSRLPKWDYLRRSKKTSSPKPHSLQILKIRLQSNSFYEVSSSFWPIMLKCLGKVQYIKSPPSQCEWVSQKLSPNTTEVWRNRREQSMLVHVCVCMRVCMGGGEGGRDRDSKRHAETSIDRDRETQRNRNRGRDRDLLVPAGEENMWGINIKRQTLGPYLFRQPWTGYLTSQNLSSLQKREK